nr:MAG TPA: hypothetical protein [Caudoviricetes sp.]DAP60232.1 MAG TPA: hypothetical protein [Caudoviricetes sp.]
MLHKLTIAITPRKGSQHTDYLGQHYNTPLSA